MEAALELEDVAPAIDCGITLLNRELALQLARKYAREHAHGSGAFPGQFVGVKLGGFEQDSSSASSPCALAHPILHAEAEHLRISRSRPHNDEKRA